MAWIINLNHIPCFDSRYGDLGNKNGILMGLSYIWVNYNDLTATSLESMASKRNHPIMALFQVSEIL